MLLPASRKKYWRIYSSCLPHKKTFLYRNLPPFPPTAAAVEKPQQPRIVYAGLLGVALGVLDICKAIDFHLLGCSLHIYGDGNERQRIADFIAQHPNRGIFLYHPIPANEVPNMLLGYTAALIPLKANIHGAVPSKIFMSAANRLPILFSGHGEGARIVSRHGIGWVNAAGDFEQLKKNIQALQTLAAESYQELKNNCTRMMESAFNKAQQDDAFALFLAEIGRDK
jgi:glycosyltransferase involved in cell wall biosynthesis